MTESDASQAGWTESMISDLRGESAASRRTFLRRSAAAGAGALALSVAGSNAALAHEIDDEDANDGRIACDRGWTMSVWTDIARLATAVNVLLCLSLGYVWGRNYLAVRSKHTLGFLLFSVFLLAENALTLYYYLIDPDLSLWNSTQMPVVVWQVTMTFHVLQAIGLGFLTWVTWD